MLFLFVFFFRHAAQPCLEPGFELATFGSLVDLLYPQSYSPSYNSTTADVITFAQQLSDPSERLLLC